MKIKVLVRGPALSRSGYGEHTRFTLRALRSREDIYDIYLHNTNWGKTGWIWEQNEEREWFDNIINKSVAYINQGGQFDISLQVTIPNEWERLAPYNIGVTAGIETNRVSPQWIEKSGVVNHIVTISEHSKDSFLETVYQAKNNQTGEIINDFRCKTPIDIVHYPVKDYEPDNVELDLEYDFNFLCVAQVSPRKNMGDTIKWFVEEFFDQKVGLVAKITTINNSIPDRLHTSLIVKQILNEYPDRKCKVYLLHGSLTDEQMTSVYQNPKIKSLVTLTHGEGFGLPIFEAVYNELPVIAPNWSGHIDFLYAPVKDKKTGKEKMKAHFAKVKHTMERVPPAAVWDGVLQADSMWCCAEQGSYKMKLREMYKDYNRFKSQAKKLNKWVRKNFTAEQQYQKLNDVMKLYTDQVDTSDWLSEIDQIVQEYE